MGFKSGSYGAHIENEAAYNDAVARRIRENARKGRGARWLAEDATRQEVVNFAHARMETGNNFYGKLWDAYNEWYSFTDKQEAMIRADMAKAAGFKAERRAIDSNSKHVSEVGKREVFTLTIQTISRIETDFGTMHIYKMTDAAGNIFIYKGASLGMDVEYVPEDWTTARIDRRNFIKGNTLTGKATVKAHNDRDGIAQTIISRPKFTIVE